MIYIYLFIVGSVFASFIHVYVTRTIKKESIIKPRSHCDMCNHPLKWYELVPVFSYIIQKGKCNYCKKKIDKSSLISEISTGLLFIVVYIIYGFTIKTLVGFVIVLILISICISDFKNMVILDSTLAIGVILLIILTYFDVGIKGWYSSFMYAIFAFVLMFLIKVLGDYIFRRDSLGGGDIKLAFLMGYVLPYQLFLISIVFGSLLALPYAFYVNTSKENKELPFGPFLAMGLLLAFLFQNDIINLVNSFIMVD